MSLRPIAANYYIDTTSIGAPDTATSSDYEALALM